METALLIPIYEPSEKTCRFIQRLAQAIPNPILIVDDGSGENYQACFKQMVADQPQITLLHYPDNRGKGYALKFGLRYIQQHFPTSPGVVTADGDGQHAIPDIKKLLRQVVSLEPNTLLLGTRDFTRKTTPAKSYWGNRLTSFFYYLASGVRLADTQTGLRGFRQENIPALLVIAGNRFEYEMNVLLAIKQLDLQLLAVPIATIYEDKNVQSHFRPLQDSFLIYYPLLKFFFSSIASALVDVVFFLLISLWLGQTSLMLLIATVTARLISGVFNYGLNKHYVFADQQKIHTSLWKYGLLFSCQLLLSWLGVSLLSAVISSLVVTKMLVDLCLFFFSFSIQKRFVFIS